MPRCYYRRCEDIKASWTAWQCHIILGKYTSQRVKQRAEAGFRISDFMVTWVRTWYCKLSCLAKAHATECNQRDSIKVHTKHVVQPCLQTLRIQVSGPFLESSSNFCTVEGKLHASARNKTKIFRNMSFDHLTQTLDVLRMIWQLICSQVSPEPAL